MLYNMSCRCKLKKSDVSILSRAGPSLEPNNVTPTGVISMRRATRKMLNGKSFQSLTKA